MSDFSMETWIFLVLCFEPLGIIICLSGLLWHHSVRGRSWCHFITSRWGWKFRFPSRLPWQHPSRKGEGDRRLHTQSSPNPQMEGSHYPQQGWKSLLGPSLPPSQRRGADGGASLQPSRLLTQPLLKGGRGTAVFSAVFGRNLAIIA